MRTFQTLACLFFLQICIAQTQYTIPKHNYNWLLTKESEDAYGGSICAKFLDHNTEPPLVIDAENFDFTESNSTATFNNITMSDEEGNLKFYFFKRFIRNSTGEIVEGSEDIQDSTTGDFYNQYFNTFNSVVSIPKPGSEGLYYVFFSRISEGISLQLDNYGPVSEVGFFGYDKIYYLLLDMNANNGEGEVIEKKVAVVEDTLLGVQPLAICRHANGRDWWLLMFELKPYLSYHRHLVTPTGIVDLGKYENNQLPNFRSNGSIRFTNNGHKMITKSINNKKIYIHDFDRCEGVLSNPEVFQFSTNNILGSDYFFSLSSNNRYLYTTHVYDTLFQYDLASENILSTETMVLNAYTGDFSEPFNFYQDSILGFSHIGLAPNNKIYIPAAVANRSYLRVIERPNLAGLACEPKLTGFDMGCNIGRTGWSDIVNYRIGPEDGTVCDSLGLDSKPIADFEWYPNANDSLSGTFDNLSQLNPTSYFWEFGDNTTSTLEQPTHTYAAKGTYNVCLTATNIGGSDTHCEFIFVNVPVSSSTDQGIEPIKVWPNPSAGELQVQVPNAYASEEAMHMVLYDAAGKMVFAEPVSAYFIHKFNIGLLPTGTYLCTIEKSGKVLYQTPLVKQ